jgi:hypothetical protein
MSTMSSDVKSSQVILLKRGKSSRKREKIIPRISQCAMNVREG